MNNLRRAITDPYRAIMDPSVNPLKKISPPANAFRSWSTWARCGP